MKIMEIKTALESNGFAVYADRHEVRASLNGREIRAIRYAAKYVICEVVDGKWSFFNTRKSQCASDAVASRIVEIVRSGAFADGDNRAA